MSGDCLPIQPGVEAPAGWGVEAPEGGVGARLPWGFLGTRVPQREDSLRGHAEVVQFQSALEGFEKTPVATSDLRLPFLRHVCQ